MVLREPVVRSQRGKCGGDVQRGAESISARDRRAGRCAGRGAEDEEGCGEEERKRASKSGSPI
jgi:hypothetical protein